MSAKIRNGIGGSDIAAIVGVHPFKTKADVYARIVHGGEQQDNHRMRLGRVAEPAIIEDYAQRHGIDFAKIERNVELVDAKRPFIRGELDGLVRGDHGIEAKLVVSPYQFALWGAEVSDEIPDQYLCQVAWYCMLAAVPRMVIVVWLNDDAREYEYVRNADFEEKLAYAGERFWHDHILKQVPPSLVGANPASIRAIFPRNNRPLRNATDDEVALVQQFAQARESRIAAETSEESFKAALQGSIADAEGIVFPGGKITWKAAKESEATDWKAVAHALNAPSEVVRKFTTQKPGSRRFLYLPAKKEK